MAKQAASAFKTYIGELKNHLASGEATEHTYRPALEAFIRSFGSSFKVTNEPSQRGKKSSKNKPDFIVLKGKVPLGYIETKDINVDLDGAASAEQIQRYCDAYPNLIVTDYVEFRRYVRGELRSQVKIGRATTSALNVKDLDGEEITTFFKEFLTEETFQVSTASELADRLAGLTKQVKRLVLNELKVEEESTRLHKLMKAFKDVLITDLDEPKFADMFAQTLAYGLFAAKVHFDGKGEFSRRTASTILPKTNPFLRKLFRECADDNLPDSLANVVDEIIDLLKKTDLAKILIEFGADGKEDAVVYFYESFLKAYDAKLRKDMGVFYTPAPVVQYMVRGVDKILRETFNRKKGIADEKTLVLDPALGTGSYLKHVINAIHAKIPEGKWDSYVEEHLLKRIFGFEIMMAPYAVAHLKLGLQLQETGYQFNSEERLGVYLTNTLEDTAKKSDVLFGDWISEEANAAAKVKRDSPIMVVMGNPPYSYNSANDGKWIDSLLHGYDEISKSKTENYYECEGQPLGERNPRGLNDDYVKFIRFAQWRVTQTGHGVVALITNHGFLDNPTFRGMRESLINEFDELYVLDLHGNSNKGEKGPRGEADQNVFEIQQGVCISFLVRSETRPKVKQPGRVFRADLYGSKEDKLAWLEKTEIESTGFKEVKPISPNYVFHKTNAAAAEEYKQGMKLPEIFSVNSVGIVTFRDELTIQFSETEAWETVRKFNDLTPEEAREEFNLGKDSRDWQVKLAQKDVAQSGPSKTKLTSILYRPFDKRGTYYTGNGRGFMATPREDVMKHMLGGKNLALIAPRTAKTPRHCFVTDTLACHKTYDSYDTNYTFPLFLDVTDKKNCRSNFTREATEQLSKLYPKLELDRDGSEKVFYYIYATLHSASYVERYGEQLKQDFPRIQFTNDKKVFDRLASLGEELVGIHLLKDDRLEGGKAQFAVKGSDVVETVKHDSKQKRVYINKTQYFENVEAENYEFFVGGYQVLEKWLKDRKDRKLSYDDKAYYERLVEAITLTKKMIVKIDAVVEDTGGWPLTSSKSKQAA